MTGEELRKLRESTGLSREQFANLVLGVTGASVARWERERCPIDALKADDIRTRVADYLRTKRRK